MIIGEVLAWSCPSGLELMGPQGGNKVLTYRVAPAAHSRHTKEERLSKARHN